MNQTDNLTENRTGVVAEAIAAAKKADEMRGAAIKELLAQQEQIARDLKALGYVPGAAITPANGHGSATVVKAIPTQHARRFRDEPLADVARILLNEAMGGELHGKEIETLSRAGGFKGGTNNFQNYLPVALKRAGGFENVGGNRWRLNEKIAPQRP